MDSSVLLDDPLLALSQSLTTNFDGMLEAMQAENTVMALAPLPPFTSIPSTSSSGSHNLSLQPNGFEGPPLESTADRLCIERFSGFNMMPPPTSCVACGHEITSQTYFMIEGNAFHESCCKCFECGVQLESKCYLKDGLMYCRADYIQRFRKSCQRCLGPIDSRQLVMQVRQSVFHLNCFTCIVCGEMLRQGDKFTAGLNGALACHLHMDPVAVPSLQSPNTAIPNVLLPTLKIDQEVIINPLSVRPARSSSKSDSQDEDRDSSPERGGRGQKTKRMRTSFKHHQLREMKRYFQLNHNPDAKDLKGLAQKTGLTKRVLQVWFQNARAKFRRSQVNNPLGCLSPNGCILPQVKLEQCYPTSISGASGGSVRASLSPFEECPPTTNSSFSRSISPETSTTSSQPDTINSAPCAHVPPKAIFV